MREKLNRPFDGGSWKPDLWRIAETVAGTPFVSVGVMALVAQFEFEPLNVSGLKIKVGSSH